MPSKLKSNWVTKSNWPQVFRQAAEGKGLKNILLPLETEQVSWPVQLWPILILKRVVLSEKSTTGKTNSLPILRLVLAALNAVLPGTGTIMLESSPVEPRSLSLVPPVHFCLFDTSKMYNEFHNAVEGENW